MSHAMPRRARSTLIALALLASVAAGCRREHLSSSYGQAYAAWFQSQRVNSKPAVSELTRKNLDGLDAQEASMVSRSYRRAAAGKSAGDESTGRMLMIGPSRGGNEAYVPPPSVPGGQ
jgi:hypothetical protein